MELLSKTPPHLSPSEHGTPRHARHGTTKEPGALLHVAPVIVGTLSDEASDGPSSDPSERATTWTPASNVSDPSEALTAPPQAARVESPRAVMNRLKQ